jgi:hypothetical protein
LLCLLFFSKSMRETLSDERSCIATLHILFLLYSWNGFISFWRK